MPVTARLSSRFYEKLGDEAANELVDWLNAVDTDLRADLREMNERNWQRMSAEFATLRAEIRADIAALRAEMHQTLSSHLRWTIVLWMTTLLAIAGLKFA